MKRLVSASLLSLGLVIGLNAQNYEVRFDSNPPGYPAFWPSWARPIGTSTNVSSVSVLMDAATLISCVSTNQAAVSLFNSNSVFQAKLLLNTNLNALITSYSNLTFVAQNWNSVTNAATLRLAVQVEGDLLLNLKPILQQLYQGQ